MLNGSFAPPASGAFRAKCNNVLKSELNNIDYYNIYISDRTQTTTNVSCPESPEWRIISHFFNVEHNGMKDIESNGHKDVDVGQLSCHCIYFKDKANDTFQFRHT